MVSDGAASATDPVGIECGGVSTGCESGEASFGPQRFDIRQAKRFKGASEHQDVVQNMAQGVQLIGKDNRGWHILKVDKQDKLTIYKVTIAGKNLELVSQDQTMHVYVAPAQKAFDEWELNGERYYIASPSLNDG